MPRQATFQRHTVSVFKWLWKTWMFSEISTAIASSTIKSADYTCRNIFIVYTCLSHYRLQFINVRSHDWVLSKCWTTPGRRQDIGWHCLPAESLARPVKRCTGCRRSTRCASVGLQRTQTLCSQDLWTWTHRHTTTHTHTHIHHSSAVSITISQQVSKLVNTEFNVSFQPQPWPPSCSAATQKETGIERLIYIITLKQACTLD